MLYIGKFINNFKDFYNEINSATLTGAIDVIIVKQPDGSYACSPFHVRFGKIGVLRSREKIVDIEINGVPVDIHMKLGESGEAFFVEEVLDEREVPAYLATSPIPDVPNIESEVQKMKLSAGVKTEEHILTAQNLPNLPHSIPVQLSDNAGQTLVLCETPKPSKTTCDIVSSHESSEDSKEKVAKEVVLCVPIKNEVSQTADANNSGHTDSSEEFKTKRRRRKKAVMKKRTKAKEVGVPLKANAVSRPADVAVKDEEKPEEMFQMDDDYTEGDDEGFASSGCLSRSISLPVAANLDNLFGNEWAPRKMSSTFAGEFHPFSDGDVSPHSSPIASRPPSPKSDTEYENQKIESGSPDASGPSWGWGELPNVPRRLSEAGLPSDSTGEMSGAIEGDKEEDSAVDAEKRSMLGGMLNFMRSTKKIRHMPESEGIYLSELNSDELDPELAALYFPKFKSTACTNSKAHIEDEDAESGKGPSLPNSPQTVESSGSLASQDSDSDERLSVDQFTKEKCENISYPYSDIAMSLCGGLQDLDTDLPEERFLHSLVTFDEFTENPAILHDINLVIRIGGKYYNWPTAASMLTSIIMFQRPLPEKTANQLINEHMPKKKKSKSYSSWWSWRRSESENKPELENSTTEILSISETSEMKPDESAEQKSCDIESSDSVAISIEETIQETVQETVLMVTKTVSELHIQHIHTVSSDSSKDIVLDLESDKAELNSSDSTPTNFETSIPASSPISISKTTSEDVSSGSPPQLIIESTKTEIPSLAEPETIAQISLSAKDLEEVEDEKSHKEKFKKSLRLTSEQIENLSLKEGPNEFVFSVTTAYQGTTKCTCQVFLWNYDDKIVISDIDGTITKSDVLGHILPMVGHSWAQLGVAKLFTKIQNNGYKFLYLSARAIGQARITREYLRRLRQGEICLPDGPLLLSPTSLISALHREVIERKPEEFKISCLKDIQTLFPAVMGNPFYAGFGNKINDTWAYRAVGIPITRVFTINHRGELKLELIQTFQSSYTRLSDEVDHVFTPLKPSMKVNGHPVPIFSSPEEFSYFTYWREPVPALMEDDFLL